MWGWQSELSGFLWLFPPQQYRGNAVRWILNASHKRTCIYHIVHQHTCTRALPVLPCEECDWSWGLWYEKIQTNPHREGLHGEVLRSLDEKEGPVKILFFHIPLYCPSSSCHLTDTMWENLSQRFQPSPFNRNHERK